MLKGKDFELFHTAKKLGINNISVQVFYAVKNEYYYEEGEDNLKHFVGPPKMVSSVKVGQIFNESRSHLNPFEYIVKNYQGSEIVLEDVVWLNNRKDEAKYLYAIDGYYGNDYSMGESYCELIILIQT